MSRRRNKQQPRQQQPQQPQSQINLTTAEDVVCTGCGNYTFVPAMLMKKLSKLDPRNDSGQDAYIPIQVFACNACGHINAEFLPNYKAMPDERPSDQDTTTIPDGTITEDSTGDVPDTSPIITSF